MWVKMLISENEGFYDCLLASCGKIATMTKPALRILCGLRK